MDVTGEEFETLMEVLGKLKYISTPEGAADVAKIISEQAELDSDFQVRSMKYVLPPNGTYFSHGNALSLQPQDVETIDRFTTCFRQALKFCKVVSTVTTCTL